MGNRFLVPNAVQGGLTLLSTQTLTTGGNTFSGIPNTYRDLRLIVRNFLPATDNVTLGMRFNGDSTANRYGATSTVNGTTATFNATFIDNGATNDNSVANGSYQWEILDYTNTSTWKVVRQFGASVDPTTTTSYKPWTGIGIYNQTAAISSIVIFASSGNFTSGTALLYGVN